MEIKKLIHKQATQGARTGNLSPSVKFSSLWRQDVARPSIFTKHVLISRYFHLIIMKLLTL